MTGVGHSLIGISIGVLGMPGRWSLPAKAAWLAIAACLANVPDLPLPCWGHDRYEISHSLPVLAALAAFAALLLAARPTLRRRFGGWRVPAAATAAWASHIVLDSLYSHGRGLRVLWPLSPWRLAMPIPWLHNMHRGMIDGWLLRVAAIEVATFGPVLIACVLIRRALTRRGGVGPAALPI